MQVEVGDRMVLHGRNGTRIGVVVEGDGDGGSRVRWADGGESVLSVGAEATEGIPQATWNAAKTRPGAPVTWRRGVTAGVGREASLAQEKLARKAADAEPVAAVDPEAPEQAPDHRPAAGE